MSDKYIFNKRLNGNKPHWALVIAFVLAIVSLGAVAQEPENLIDLVNPQAEAVLKSTATLDSIDFNRSAKTGNVLIGFAGNTPAVTIVEAKGKVTLTMKETALAEDQYVEVDVSQFGTAVQSIETFQDEDKSIVEIRYSGVVSVKKMDDNGLVTIAVTPLTKEELEKSQDTAYEGKPISLDFQDVPVRQVLQIIAQVNGFNLVTTDTVNGNVTISLSGVPWDQALDMILKIRGLDKRLEGNILLIAPTEELTARETQQLQSKKQVQDLAELKSANIEINYAKADEIATILKTSDGGILSTRGNVTVDARTNTILIRDTQESIDEARRVINALDIPVRQVLIESRMVTVRDNVDEQLGVRWGFTGAGDNNSTSGSIVGADTTGQGIVPDIGDRLNVNLPVSSAAGAIGFQIANLVDGNILDLELSALEAENKGEIIASPRITVANQQEAYIEQGTEIPFVQATSSGATSVEFKKAVLSLKVTPHITPDNRIILNLVVTQDTRGDTVSTSTGPAVAIDTQEISTQVLVENGETIVLGGIFQQVSTNDVTKVPLLGDIPYLGNLFKTSSTIEQKRELLIFVTPKIIEEGY
jgi:type IV pilus assembly protein PilQ